MQCEIGTNKDEKFFISMNKRSQKSQERPTLKNYHTHEHYEIININSSSKITFFIDGREYVCNSNTFMLSPPGAAHNIVRSFAGVKRILISFRKEYVADFKDFCGIDVDKLFQTSVVMFSDGNLKKLTELADSMKKEFGHDSKSPRLRLMLALFFDILGHPDSVVEQKGGASLGQSILEYIQTHYFEEITIEKLCDKFLVNRNKVCKSIKTETGMTFSEILNVVRLSHARELLENGRMSVGQIAEKVGYSSLRYFSDVFKKDMGISPSDYRKTIKNSKI